MANIRTSRRGGRVFRGGRSVRETLWVDVGHTLDTQLSASATAALINSGNAALFALAPFTIVRVRGVWLCRSDQSAATETFAGSLGYAIVSQQAVAVGISAPPPYALPYYRTPDALNPAL